MAGWLKRPRASAIALVLVLACGGIAFAAGGSGGEIHACYGKHGGALRYVGSGAAPGHCRTSERAISWAGAGLPEPSAEVGVRISAPGAIFLGHTLAVTVTVSNRGPNSAWVGLDFAQSPFTPAIGGVPVTDHGVCLTGAVTSGHFTCAIGILGAGQHASVRYRAQACQTPGQAIVIAARVVGSVADPNAANNHAAASVRVVAGQTGCG